MSDSGADMSTYAFSQSVNSDYLFASAGVIAMIFGGLIYFRKGHDYEHLPQEF